MLVIPPSSDSDAGCFIHSDLSCSKFHEDKCATVGLFLLPQTLPYKEVGFSMCHATRCRGHGRDAWATAVVPGVDTVASTN